MEEKNINEANEIKKPSYEELNNFCNQLMMQNRELGRKLNEVGSALTKLPFLFDVLNYSKLFDKETVDEAVLEIKELLFYKEPEEAGIKKPFPEGTNQEEN